MHGVVFSPKFLNPIVWLRPADAPTYYRSLPPPQDRYFGESAATLCCIAKYGFGPEGVIKGLSAFAFAGFHYCFMALSASSH
jgi:hypothetical protein